MKTITLHIEQHYNKEVICFRFEIDFELIDILKTKLNARWSYSKKAWYIPFRDFDLNKTLEVFKNKANIDNTAIGKTQNEILSPVFNNEIAFGRIGIDLQHEFIITAM